MQLLCGEASWFVNIIIIIALHNAFGSIPQTPFGMQFYSYCSNHFHYFSNGFYATTAADADSDTFLVAYDEINKLITGPLQWRLIAFVDELHV